MKSAPKFGGKDIVWCRQTNGIWAVGIGRAFMYASEGWAKLHNDKNVDITNTNEYWPEDTAYREYIFKLQKVKDRIFTETWKEMAKKKHEVMVNFFDNLNEEVWGIKRLK